MEYPVNDRASSAGESIPARADLATAESPRGHEGPDARPYIPRRR